MWPSSFAGTRSTLLGPKTEKCLVLCSCSPEMKQRSTYQDLCQIRTVWSHQMERQHRSFGKYSRKLCQLVSGQRRVELSRRPEWSSYTSGGMVQKMHKITLENTPAASPNSVLFARRITPSMSLKHLLFYSRILQIKRNPIHLHSFRYFLLAPSRATMQLS